MLYVLCIGLPLVIGAFVLAHFVKGDFTSWLAGFLSIIFFLSVFEVIVERKPDDRDGKAYYIEYDQEEDRLYSVDNTTDYIVRVFDERDFWTLKDNGKITKFKLIKKDEVIVDWTNDKNKLLDYFRPAKITVREF